MNISKIEENLQEVLSNFTPETFIYDLLGAYGKPKASITRLQKKGDYNRSKEDGEILGGLTSKKITEFDHEKF